MKTSGGRELAATTFRSHRAAGQASRRQAGEWWKRRRDINLCAARRSSLRARPRHRENQALAVPEYFHLFTYGTLKSAVSTPAGRELLRDCERVAEGAVGGTLYDAGEYPALLLGGGGRVKGEVWRCPVPLLRVLDRYEGAAEGLFRRVAVEVGDVVCWVYVAGPKLGPRLRPDAIIESGSWTR